MLQDVAEFRNFTKQSLTVPGANLLQGVVGCCRELQSVAGCCKVLQGVAVFSGLSRNDLGTCQVKIRKIQLASKFTV